ncbi:TonB-dependent receptor [Sphingobacterium sp. HJSM2_6]|uniref:TonB-dependent receptor n=1 Tax=Sphingobacterium sp. HJSM2_6 TaxID=3366264 RepID=UPI003BE21D9D
MSKYMLAIVLMLSSWKVSAQSTNYSSLIGKVMDDNQQVLVGASIRLYSLNLKTKSNEQGTFVFHKIPNHRNYRLKIQLIGYEDYEDIIHLSHDSTINIHLHTAVQEIESIRVTGHKPEQNTAVIQALSNDQIAESKGKLAAEVFSQLSGVSILSSGHGVAKPVIHGLHSNRVILLNQGVKLEGQQWGMEHAPELDPFSADEFELIKGAQSVRYGADALGGVLISKSKPIKTDRISGKADLLAQTNGQGLTGNLQLEGGLMGYPGLGWRIQGSGKKLGDRRTASYNLGNTGTEEKNASANLNYQTDAHQVDAYYSLYSAEQGIFYGAHIGTIEDIYARLAHDEPLEKYAFSYQINAPKQEVNHHLARLKYQYILSDDVRLEAQYGFQRNHRKEFDMRRSVSDDIPMSDLVLTSQDLNVHLKLNKHTIGLQSGIQVNNNIAGTGTTPIIPNFDSYQIALFGIHQYQMNKLTLEAGWRYDYKSFDAAGYRFRYNEENSAIPEQYLLTDNRSFQNISGNLGVQYSFHEAWAYKSNLGLAWRAPTANELYSDGVHHAAAIYELGNLDLKTEKGLKWIHSLTFAPDQWNISADVYAQGINGYIYSMPDPLQVKQTIRGTFPLFKYEQHDALFYGADFSASWSINTSFAYQITGSMVRAKNRENNSYLPYIPSDRFGQHIQWNFHNNALDYVKLSHQFVSKQNRFMEGSDYAAAPASYHLFNLFITRTIPLNQRTAKVSLAVDNLLNKSYKDYMDRFRYYAHRPGRNFTLSFQYNF